jgi:hypothetical protein
MAYLKRVAIFIATLEIVYLLIFNIALNIPLTQELINRIKPDKFAVSWESAWTFYPFRVHASSVAANGQARSQQWQLETPEASASISLFPLILKTVSLNRVEARDVSYFQRPRPRPDKDYSKTRPYFPPIEGRELEVEPPRLPPRKAGKKPWTIHIQEMLASGEHNLWLYQVQANLKGDVMADLSVVTQGGPLSISNGDLDLAVNSIKINGNREVSREGHIKGKIEVLPFIVKENKGFKAQAFLELDVELSSLTESLKFLNVYLGAFEGMQLDGAGDIQGRIVFSQGKLLEQSNFDVLAHSLSLKLLEYAIEGEGNIHIEVPEEASNSSKPDAHFAIAFTALDAFYADNPNPMLTGNGLVFHGVGTNNIIPLNGTRPEAKSMALSISSLKVPNLNAFQRFLPKKWVFKLHGGEGELRGTLAVDHSSLSSSIQLSSDDAEVGFNDLRFNSNLDIGLNLNSPSLESGRVEISDSHFKLNEALVANGDLQSEPWHAAINIEKGIIRLNLGEADAGVSGATHVLQTMREQQISTLLSAADEELNVNASISDLRWLNILVKNPYNLVINGDGEITSNVVIKAGWLETGTELAISPQRISVEILDYITDGDGAVSLKVIKGGEFPDIALAIDIGQAQFRRKLEDQAFVEDVDILLRAEAREVKPGAENQDVSLRLQIPSAKVTDMSVYNQYLPENSPLKITGGEAELVADIRLEAENADGYINLDTHDLRAQADDQDISAELGVKIILSGGKPKDMKFDISGSTLKLDAVKVIGESASFREEDWAAEIRFKKAQTVWKKPLQLDVQAEIDMTDSIPIVAMMENQKGKETWLTKALTIDDVKGDINLSMANNQIVIPYAFAGSDNIDIGAKAIINSENRNGMIYVRYKALKGLLKINDGKRNIDVLSVQEKFDAYSTDSVIMEKRLPNEPVL